MDSFEWNKVAAALLVGFLLFMGVSLFTENFFGGEEEVVLGPEKEIDAGQQPTQEVSEPESNIMALIADANIAAGERTFRKCQTCHTVTDGGGHRVGPNLFGVVGSAVASKDGYAYSPALSARGGTWDYETLNSFLLGPSAAVPGTKMTFAGLPKADERANIIAYLRTQSANPLPLPEVPAEETPGEASSSEGS